MDALSWERSVFFCKCQLVCKYDVTLPFGFVSGGSKTVLKYTFKRYICGIQCHKEVKDIMSFYWKSCYRQLVDRFSFSVIIFKHNNWECRLCDNSARKVQKRDSTYWSNRLAVDSVTGPKGENWGNIWLPHYIFTNCVPLRFNTNAVTNL